jgi:hypothetical protein
MPNSSTSERVRISPNLEKNEEDGEQQAAATAAASQHRNCLECVGYVTKVIGNQARARVCNFPALVCIFQQPALVNSAVPYIQ